VINLIIVVFVITCFSGASCISHFNWENTCFGVSEHC